MKERWRDEESNNFNEKSHRVKWGIVVKWRKSYVDHDDPFYSSLRLGSFSISREWRTLGNPLITSHQVTRIRISSSSSSRNCPIQNQYSYHDAISRKSSSVIRRLSKAGLWQEMDGWRARCFTCICTFYLWRTSAYVCVCVGGGGILDR